MRVVLTVAPQAGANVPEGPMTFFPDDRAIMSATTTGGQLAVGQPLILRLPFLSQAIAPPRLRGVLVAKSAWVADDRNRAMRVDVTLEMSQRK